MNAELTIKESFRLDDVAEGIEQLAKELDLLRYTEKLTANLISRRLGKQVILAHKKRIQDGYERRLPDNADLIAEGVSALKAELQAGNTVGGFSPRAEIAKRYRIID